ncbi:hypothetical protein BHM03_00036110 [Ensete ventricosum]|nr:hypothetical protein BHM03_00036110 [Ensete ventricosum]
MVIALFAIAARIPLAATDRPIPPAPAKPVPLIAELLDIPFPTKQFPPFNVGVIPLIVFISFPEELTPFNCEDIINSCKICWTELCGSFGSISCSCAVGCCMVDKLPGEIEELKLILHGAKDEGSFEAHAPYLREAFNEGTNATQLAEAKLGSKGLGTGQEDAKAPLLKNMPQCCHPSYHEESGAYIVEIVLCIVVEQFEIIHTRRRGPVRDLIMQRDKIRAIGELDYSRAHIRLRQPSKSVYKIEAEAKELRKTSVNVLLIKIAESEELRVDARVLDQGMKLAVRSVVPFLLRGVGDKDDGEDTTIPEVTKTIKDLL